MVEKSSLSRKIDSRLRSVRSCLEALPWYLERYGDGSETSGRSSGDQVALHYEWGDTFDRLSRAHAWYPDGEMGDEQAERHRENLALLAAQIPVIRQLGLVEPSGALAVGLVSTSPSQTRARPA